MANTVRAVWLIGKHSVVSCPTGKVFIEDFTKVHGRGPDGFGVYDKNGYWISDHDTLAEAEARALRP